MFKKKKSTKKSVMVFIHVLLATLLAITVGEDQAKDASEKKNYSVLLDLRDVNRFFEEIVLNPPEAGSPRVFVTATGNLMTHRIHGLEKQMSMPSGDGEENMRKFALDVSITQYLDATNQLSSDVEEKAKDYMEKGYQREMNYWHRADEDGSTWLVAYVAKSFYNARDYIEVDDTLIAEGAVYLLNLQQDDGSFKEGGRNIPDELEDVALTANVLTVLLETRDLPGLNQKKIDASIQKAQKYIEDQLSSLTDPQMIAISSYALKLVDSPLATTAFAKLNELAVFTDGIKHWNSTETDSYALLVYCLNKDIASSRPIVKWIVAKIQNDGGRYLSTKETIIGLQALTEFVLMVRPNDLDIIATVTAEKFSQNFYISHENALLLQHVELPIIPSKVSISVEGHGLALVHINYCGGCNPDFYIGDKAIKFNDAE